MLQSSVSSKIVVYTCGTMALLLFLSSFLMIISAQEQEEAFVNAYQEQIEQSIAAREHSEKLSLQKNVAFNTTVLSKISAIHLYNIDDYGLKEAVRPYMEYPEILAIRVQNEKGEPFAAMWKTPEIQEGTQLPEKLPLDVQLSVQVDVVQDQLPVGQVQVFYTEQILNASIQQARKQAVLERKTLEDSSSMRLSGTIRNQIIGGLFILLTLVACQVIALRVLIFKPLLTVARIARKLSELDLQVNLQTTRQDEIGRLFTAINEMILSFKRVISQVQRAGVQVTSSSTELAATSKQQEVTLKNQMDATRHAVKSVKEISDLATDLVETMQQAVTMLEETIAFANRGQTDLSRMEETMGRMEQASTAISGKLEVLHTKAENITAVVTTITKVADQTNLLSLNAAIEAEKAGEYGRGFTVVAREIRRLADQTAVATLDIEQMVQEMQAAVSAGVTEIATFITEVGHSAEDVEKIGLQLTKIIEQVQTLAPNFEHVNAAIEHQSEHAQNINDAMIHLSEEMAQTTESLKESFTAITQLNEAARGLQEEVSRFKVT